MIRGKWQAFICTKRKVKTITIDRDKFAVGLCPWITGFNALALPCVDIAKKIISRQKLQARV